jgi:rhodanese-related sulfurtransferase
MSLESLLTCQQPVILHARSPVRTRYSHWILYLGCEQGKVRIYDPPRESGTLTTTELLSIWDGVAIVVSRKGQGSDGLDSSLMPAAMSTSALLLVVAAFAILDGLSKRTAAWKAILLSTLLLAGIAHVFQQTGFVHGRDAIRNVQSAFFSVPIPKLGLSDLKELLDAKKCVLVDARPSDAFETFHLPEAVNLPIHSGFLRIRQAASELETAAPVVVYCQSETCPWADAVAKQLVSQGREEVYVYSGGVDEWRSRVQ